MSFILSPIKKQNEERWYVMCDVEYNPVVFKDGSMIFEPKWKSLMANTVGPLFTPSQCRDIINMGHQQKQEEAEVGHKYKAEGKL